MCHLNIIDPNKKHLVYAAPHATAFFNRETTHFNGCSFFILNSDYKTLQQYMDSIRNLRKRAAELGLNLVEMT